MTRKPTTNIPALDRILEWPRPTLAQIDEERRIHERWMAHEITAAEAIELRERLAAAEEKLAFHERQVSALRLPEDK